MALPPDLLLSALVVGVAAAVQGFFGFGFAIVAMSALTFSHDLLHAAGVVNVLGLLITSTLALSLRHGILWRLLGRMVPALLVGVVLGVSALQSLDRTFMVRLLGLSILAVAAWNLLSPRLRTRDSLPLDLGMGLLAGLLGGAFNTSGPAVVVHLYRRAGDPEHLKATVQGLFLTVGLTRLPTAMAQGLIDLSVWRDAALGAPFVLAGVGAGAWLARRSDPERFRRWCWLALGALGVALLVAA